MAILDLTKTPRHLVSQRSSRPSGIPAHAEPRHIPISHTHKGTNYIAGRGTNIVKLGESSILGIS